VFSRGSEKTELMLIFLIEHWSPILGYASALLSLAAFSRQTLIPLRILAIASNVGFVIYAGFENQGPTLLLHACLLPLNSIRLHEMIRLTRGIHDANTADFSLEALAPFMRHETYDAGDVVFEKGDAAKRMYVILNGTVDLVEFGKQAKPGDVLGEIGLFAPGGERTATAICRTACEMQSVTYDTVMQLYFQNPQFGLFLLQIITGRLLANIEALQRDTSPASYGTPIHRTEHADREDRESNVSHIDTAITGQAE
jgi:CRP/FNR family cyclic AMP-dependent transcriptional regulator